MRILDLFCGAGGWADAFVPFGWEVVGVDCVDFSSVYPGCFVQGDALAWGGLNPLEFEFIVASPPCEEFARAWLPWKRADKSPAPWAVGCLAWAVREARRRENMLVECSAFAARHVGGGVRVGSWCLWGQLPVLVGEDVRRKVKVWGGRGGSAERAKIPPCLGSAVAWMIKQRAAGTPAARAARAGAPPLLVN